MTDAAVPTLTVPGRIAQALLAGEQVIDLRLQPADGGPPPGATRFWLRADPGAQPELKPAYQRARELSLPADEVEPGQVRIDGWAELAGTATTVVDDQTAEALNGKTILALDALAGQEVLVLALRAHRLVEPVTVPDDLSGLPADPAEGPPSRAGLVGDGLPGPLRRPARRHPAASFRASGARTSGLPAAGRASVAGRVRAGSPGCGPPAGCRARRRRTAPRP